MAYSVIIQAEKPANVAWWGPANRTKSTAIRTLTSATSGLISSTSGQSPSNPNVWVTTQLWEDKAHYDAYGAALATNTYWQERLAYAQANNIVVTKHEGNVTLA